MDSSTLMQKFRKSNFSQETGAYFRRNGGLIIGLVILCLIVIIRAPTFLSQRNIMNVLRQISANMFLATAMTMILIAGGIDLSVGSTIGVVGVFSATLLAMHLPVPLVILFSLAVGAFIGFINGIIISRTTLPPFIVTFAMMSILRGFAYVYTNASVIPIDNRAFISMGTGYVGVIPLPVIYMIVILVGAYFLLNKSILGRHIYATGGNEKAAIYSGINVKQVRLFVYVFSGVMASVAGMVLAARSYSGNPIFGTGAEMDAIAACALGGMGLGGGNGYIGGTFIGALIIGVLNNGLNLMGIGSFWQQILRGVVILAAMYVDYIKGLKKVKVSV